MELYKKYRPKNLRQIIGQDVAVNTLKAAIEKDNIPHFIMFTGPRGCGKTTLARIMRRKLKCSKYDFVETAPRKVEAVREIKSRINLAAIKGKRRVFLIDECHKLTSDAQDEFLKMLEDGCPSHVYFLFTTTEPQKMKSTIKDRCTEIVVKPLNEKNLTKLIKYVCKEERVKISEEVIEKIVDNSNGSARKALVFLDGVINLKTKSEQLNAIVTVTAETQAIAIARALFNPKTKWLTMARILKETEGEEAEQIRYMILGYAKTIILSGGKLSGRAYIVIGAFGDNFYESKWAGLAAAAYEVIVGTD